MNRSVLSGLAVVALLSAAAVSQAQVYSYELITGTTVYTTFPGVTPTTTNDPTITNFFAPSGTVNNPQSYSTPSVLKFGDDTTTPGTFSPNTTATWNNVPISFQFMLDMGTTIGPTAQAYTVTGFLDGSLGYDGTDTPFSRAHVTYTSITDNTTGGTAVVSSDPENTESALLIDSTFGGNTVALYLDINQSKPIPGDIITHVGFIESTSSSVPEPGSVAMIVGFGISGSAFLTRKRRRA
jgi:hypothetical protein